MKALTLYLPWSFLVERGLKRNETRNWKPPAGKTSGWFCIHAGLGVDQAVMRDNATIRAALAAKGVTVDNWSSRPGSMQQRAIVAIVHLADIRPTSDALYQSDEFLESDECEFGHYGPNRYVWVTDQTIRLEHVVPLSRGRQKLFTVDGVPAQRVLAQADEALARLVTRPALVTDYHDPEAWL